jgi:hypothetical protein
VPGGQRWRMYSVKNNGSHGRTREGQLLGDFIPSSCAIAWRRPKVSSLTRTNSVPKGLLKLSLDRRSVQIQNSNEIAKWSALSRHVCRPPQAESERHF